MANNPKKIQDPTEVALSAIQEALEVRGQETAAEANPALATTEPEIAPDVRRNAPRSGIITEEARNGSAERPLDGAAPEDDDELLAEAPIRALPRGEEPPVSRRPAANDDRQTIGQILQAVQRRPSRMSFTMATVFSTAWLVGGAGLAWLYMPQLETILAESRGVAPLLIGLGALYFLPIFFFYALAHMVSRSQELRLMAQSMAEVAIRLAEPETVAHESIVSVGQAIRREVVAMGDGVERALARAAELEALVHNEVSALERAYNDNEVRIRGLLHDLASQRDTLVSQAEQVRNAISGVHLDLSQEITAVTDLVAERVSETAQRITHTLADKGEHITLALGRAGDSMINALTERGGDLLERLEHTSDQTTHAISTATERMTASLNFKTDHIQQEFAGLANNLKQSVNSQMTGIARDFEQRSQAVVDMMGGRTEQMAAAIIDNSAHIAETIAGRVEEVNSMLKATGDSLVLDLSLRGGDVVANLEQTGAQITEALVANSGKVTEGFREKGEDLARVVDAKGEAVKNMLAARLLAFEEMFTHGGAELGEKITRESTMLGNLITRHLAEFDRTVKIYGGELVERLGQRTEEVAEAMRTYVDGFDSRVGGRSEEMANALDRRLTGLEETLDGRKHALEQALESRKQALDQSLASRISEIADTIDSHGLGVAKTLVGKIEDIDRTLGSRALEVAGNLDSRIQRIEELNASVQSSSSVAERRLTDLSANISSTLKQNAEDVERTLLGVSAEVARTFVGKADEIAAAVSARAAEMTSVLDQSSSGLLSALTNKSEDFAAQVGRATEHALTEIDTKGNALTKALTDQSSDIARGINEASFNATTAVNRTLKELNETTQSAIERSKQTASATVSEMLATHGMLRSDTTTLFERLREANILLQEVLSGAHDNMSSLENMLVTRVSDFVSAMNEVTERSGAATNKVDEQIGKFNAVTTRVLGDLAQFATQFEGHGRGLAQAVNLIDRSNRRTEETLAERRVSLDELVSALDTRTGDLEQRLKHFTGLLDETLDTAAGRAQEIARIVSDTSSSGAQAITEQFDRVRSTVDEQRQRTAETMRSIYEDARNDTNAIFRQSTERFTEVIHGMKHMAAEMQRELETTRSELRRGILELPQETAESAAQMRRVIVDQIEALAELNRIVARHGRGLDAPEPARRTAAGNARERDEVGPQAGSGERAETPRPAPRRELPSVSLTGSSNTAARRTEAPALGPTPGNDRASGWLSDLLQRASRDEEPVLDAQRETAPREAAKDERTAAHSIESLDSLSVDIARMIDHNAAIELWDRYKRGERNVFTRRLYTLQGQKAFDDITKKYRADREFRQTVDRYITEFEKLLDEVSRDDRGQVVARTYLTSETGKVYTMLAHAAGRFE
jgi:hypothetical protein